MLQLSEPPKNILPEERKIYDTIKNDVLLFKNLFFTQENTKNTDSIKNIDKLKNEQKTEGFKKVKILKDIPQYIGSDGNMYGPYKINTSVSIPANEVDFLISNKMAKEIE